MKRLGDVLVESGIITQQQLDQALARQKQTKARLGETLMEMGVVTESQIYKVLERIYQVPYVELSNISVDKNTAVLISERLARKHKIMPIKREGNVLTVAISDPLDFDAIDDVQLATGLEIKTVISRSADIMNAIDRYYGSERAEQAAKELNMSEVFESFDNLAKLSEEEVGSAPVVRLIDSLIHQALRSRASDIHIEPMKDHMRVRFRIDGELAEVLRLPKAAHGPVITRLKILGKMDIGEKRLPQDGSMVVQDSGADIDLRLSVLPTVYGEKVVVRILGRDIASFTKERLGFTAENFETFMKIIKNPHGLILVTGPTGSGKTTTLYAILQELNRPGLNIITVEDPVEYRMDGVNQLQVNTKSGLTFAVGLRAILRQDPDIVMIGEIRDSETAQIAVRASITGHLVLSTLHTNDAVSSITRLVDMGVAPYLVSSSVVGVIAQRLVRKICPRCKHSYMSDRREMKLLNLTEPRPLYKGAGCPVCNNTGYFDRMAVHEVLPVVKEIRELIDLSASADQLWQAAERLGVVGLRESCEKLVLSGETTTEELIKVAYSMD